MKKLFKVFLLILVLSILSGITFLSCKFKPEPNQLTLNDKELKTSFQWVKSQFNDRTEPYGAMLVPVKIEGCPRTFFMQFDFGHPTTIFYKCILDEVNLKYKNLSYQKKGNKFILKDYSFGVGSSKITAKEISVLDCKVQNFNWGDSTSIITIGTIGSDIIENKVMLIDYPAQRISISESMPDSIAKTVKMSDFKFKFRRILLPAVIRNETKNIYFDSGSSSFELITDEGNWAKLAQKGQKEDIYKINHWGKPWTAHTISSTDTITFNSIKIPLKNVTYMEGEGTKGLIRILYKLVGVGGLTGNKLFLNKKVLIDTKNLKYAIIDP
jgi:hypothetical protein